MDVRDDCALGSADHLQEREMGTAETLFRRGASELQVTPLTCQGFGLPAPIGQAFSHLEPIADRHFEIEFLDPGIAAFDFTFG